MPRTHARTPQVPHLDGVEASRRSVAKRGLFQSLRMVVGGLHDHVRTISRQPAAYLPLVGAPGTLAFMQLDEGEMAAYYSKHPKNYQVGGARLAGHPLGAGPRGGGTLLGRRPGGMHTTPLSSLGCAAAQSHSL